MKSIAEQIRIRLRQTERKPTDQVPIWIRNIARLFGGGDTPTAQFVRGVFWRYRWLVVLSVLASVASGLVEALTLGVFTLALNSLTAQFSDISLVPNGAVNTITLQIASFFGGQSPFVVLILIAVILQLIRSALDYGGQVSSTLLSVWLEADVQRRVFSQLITLRYQEIVGERVGNLATYPTLVREIGVLITIINRALNDLIIMLSYLVVLFWLSWQFTLLAIVILALLSSSLASLRTGIRQSIKGYLDTVIRTNSQILEYLHGIRLIHIFGREELVVQQVGTLVDSGIRPRRIAYMRRALITPLFQSMGIIGIAIFLAGGYWVVTNTIYLTVAELAAFLFGIYRILPRISSYNAQLGQISSQWPYVVRVAELLDTRDKELEYKPGKEIQVFSDKIELRSVDLRYPEGERDALNNLTLQIPRGHMVALVGSSGSGKSSIVNLLLGLYRPTGGQILIDGLDLQSYDLASWRKLIGVVDQDTLIFSSDIATNIRFGKPNATDEEVVAAAQIANADGFIEKLPNGYKTEVGDRGYRLSGGQRQRIAIARAIIHNPEIILFDEATSALDSQTERMIQESLDELRKERTVVSIAHRLSTVVNADQIIVLDGGHIAEQGTHQSLLAQNGRYAAMWRLQAHSE